MNALHALLVGINQYHPQTNIPSLNGCINDVQMIKVYLEKRSDAAATTIKVLTNETATRQAVIDNFITILCNKDIQAGDTVLFYYSGHGSYAKSNKAFMEDSEGRDETLVLYDSRLEDNFDLADKEIALLLYLIPKHANIVVIIDSCHSGSITRDVDITDELLLGKAKHTAARRGEFERSLDNYASVDGLSYAKMFAENGKVEIPSTKHILLAACDRTEVAYESDSAPNALFTGLLVKLLDNSATNTSYTQLFEQLYTMLRRRAKKQTPQLKVFEGYNPDMEFLGTKIYSGDPEYIAIKENGVWTINCGSINGLKNDAASMKQMAVQLYNEANESSTARFAAIGLNKSELAVTKLPGNLYKAAVINKPPTITILVKVTGQAIADWNTVAASKKRQEILFTSDEANAAFDYILLFDNNSIYLLKADGSTLVHGIKTITDDTMRYMLQTCQQVAGWHNLLNLENQGMAEEEFIKRFKTTFSIEAATDAELSDIITIDKDVTLYISDQIEKYYYRIHLTTSSANKFYVAVYYMSNFYSIKKRTLEIDASIITKGQLLASLDKIRPLKLNDTDEDHDRFKLIISETPFFDHTIQEQDKLEAAIQEPDDAILVGVWKDADDEEGIDKTWFAKTITVHLAKSNGSIDANQSFSSGKISIAAHPSFAATAAFLPVTQGSKAVTQQSQLVQLLQQEGQQVIRLTQGAKSDTLLPDIIQLGDIRNVEDLKDEPLKMTIHEALEDGEQLVALTMQDDIIIPLAWSVADKKTASSELAIHHLPEADPDPQKKNILRAAWFCLVKIVTTKNLSMLRTVTIDNGKVKYTKDELFGKVAQAKKIVLLVHGIIGTTKNIAEGLQFLLHNKDYDLMLAYDYENLNTKIEDIAEDMKEHLVKAGISNTKNIDIIAHSMGGLVSRYMIEHLEGTDNWVNRLYMFGTPNDGSKLGDIPKWRDRITAVLTIACNVARPILGTFAPVLDAVNKGLAATIPITNTLAQMDDESDFYKLLNAKSEKPTSPKYYCIAGKMQDYTPPAGSRLKKIIEKIEMGVGHLFYHAIPNDIAVSVTSIHTVPHQETVVDTTVGCHHLNYFETEASLAYFKTLTV